MSDKLRKIKNKMLARAAVLAVIFGILAALGVVGAMLLVVKLTANLISLYYYLTVGACVFVIVFLVLFLVAIPKTYPLSEKLDKRFDLDEREQTMVEYASFEGGVYEAQRQDAERALSRINALKPEKGPLTIRIIAAIVCLALFFGGIFVKSLYEEPHEPEYVPDVNKLELLETVIEKVRGDEILTSDIHDLYVEDLERLYDLMSSADLGTQSVAETVLDTYMTDISKLTVYYCTYDDVVRIFASSDLVYISCLAEPLDILGNYATEGTYNSTLPTTYSRVESIYAGMSKNISDEVSENIDGNIRAEIGRLTNDTGETVLQNFIDWLSKAADEASSFKKLAEDDPDNLVNQMYREGYFDDVTDSLCLAIEVFKDEIEKQLTYFVNKVYGIGNIRENIVGQSEGSPSPLNTFASSVTTAMTDQAYTKVMDYYIRYSISDIFGVDMKEYKVSSDEDSDDSDEEEESGESGGTTGEGSLLYPSNDQILNPNTSDSDFYYNIYNNDSAYRDIFEEMLQNPDIPDEIKAIINSYLSALFTQSGN